MDIKQEFEAFMLAHYLADDCGEFVETSTGGYYKLTAMQTRFVMFKKMKASQLSNSDGYAKDVEKAVKAAKKWNKEIPELTDHSPINAIDTLAILLLQERESTPTPDGDRLDAERYRHVRQGLMNCDFSVKALDSRGNYVPRVMEKLDVAIDQAIANKEVK